MKARLLRTGDFQDLVETYYTYFKEYEKDPDFGFPRSFSRPPMAEEVQWFANLQKEVAEGKAIVMVGEVDSHAVGLCKVTKHDMSPETAHRGKLEIGIRKEQRGKGLGTLMVGAMIKQCTGKFDVLELSVFSHNAMAIKLYQKLGFKKIGVRPRAIKRDGRYIEEDLMVLLL